jgi:RNA polymerase sigma-70 factor (ECF subfamily)
MDVPPDDYRFARRWLEAQPAVASFLTALVPDPHAVDDLIQEVALTVYRRLDDYDERRSFTGWALGIARYKALERWRGLDRERRMLALDPELLATLVAVGEELAEET